jgi:glutamate 5-kinase
MSEDLRKTLLADVKRVVIKVGTAVLTDVNGGIDTRLIHSLCEQIHELRSRGYTVVLVSSGAVGAGVSLLNLKERPTAVPRLQAAASVGQAKLISLYDDSFETHGYHAAQMLLTREDFEDRARYVNARNTLWALFDLGAVPIINENDTLATEELRFGDNDILSVLVAHLLHADLLIILSNVDGLLRPAARNKPEELLSLVKGMDESIFNLVQRKHSRLGSGGMGSKLEAVKKALDAGEPAIIANGRKRNVLPRIMDGQDIGTLFAPSAPKMRSWKRWISFAARPRGHIHVDEGALNALSQNGKSLLASGITSVRGDFKKGDVVVINLEGGASFARGLTNYSSEILDGIKGLQTNQVKKKLGEDAFIEVIHRNNMVLLS